MDKKNLEIIDVQMDIDIADEIKKKVDSLSSELLEHTRKVIKSKVKVQKTNKKKLLKEKRDIAALRVIKFLEKAYAEPDFWVEGKHLTKVAGLENTPQNLNKLSMQIRRLLEKDDVWTLSKSRKSRKTLYRLARFS
jgi:hypothetical protein